MRWRFAVMAGVLGVMVMASGALAVRPGAWVFSSEGDFAKGSFEGTVVDSHGRLTLGRQMTAVDVGEGVQMVAGMVEGGDGAVYVGLNSGSGANAGGKVVRIVEGAGKGVEVYQAPREFSEITAMGVDGKGNVLVGMAGDKARVVRISAEGKSEAVFENEDVGSVWAILAGADGAVYVGTGPEGKVFRAGEEGGSGKVVLETGAKNVMSLALDKDGNLVAGTDGKGLVIRLDGKTGKGSVLLDAGKVDVTALVQDRSGAMYVATARAKAEDGDEAAAEEPETKSVPTAPEAGAKVERALGKGAVQKLKGGAETQKKPGAGTQRAKAERGKESDLGLRLRPLGEAVHEKEGNCVYRISVSGTVTKVVEEEDMNNAMAWAGEDLLIGTGGEGKLYRYQAGEQALALVARLKQEQVTALLATKEGEVFVGTANMGGVYRMGKEAQKKGTFTSQVMDAGHTATWGRVSAEVLGGGKGKVTVATRSGNTRSAEGADGKFWSAWSKEMEEGGKADSPAARYLQVRVTMEGEGDGAGLVVNRVRAGYEMENLAPRVTKVSADAGALAEGAAADRSGDLDVPAKVVHVTWEADDPNGDTLEYRVMYRGATGRDGKEDVWTPLGKNLKETSFEWDARGLSDGKYEVKVIASDKADNVSGEAKEAARVCGPIVIDHTPPVVGGLKAEVEGGKAKVTGEATDGGSAVVDVRFQVDGQGDWQPASASDKMFDSAHEGFSLETAELGVGGHRVTVRATDAAGNSSYAVATVVVKR